MFFMFKFFLFCLLPFACFAGEPSAEYLYLDSLALATDPNRTSGKGSNWHNYTEVYAKYLAPLCSKPIKFLEIGIFEGNGVKLWEAYFPYAELHFIDITFSRVKYFSPRSFYHLADQADANQLRAVINNIGGGFDVIIDDGGHTMQQQIVSFKTLFPYVKSGGLYIIEDLHTSYWNSYGGDGSFDNPKAGPTTCIGFLKNLIDDVNYVGARTLSADHNKVSPALQMTLTEYQKDIYSMHFYDSLCIILKR
jgi:hypothetical protein